MFDKETVFILGAGASWHYGYPTGEDLNQFIKEAAARIKVNCEHLQGETALMREPPKYFLHLNQDPVEGLRIFMRECDLLINTLNQVNPLVIDYFLHDHPSLQNIGKLFISYVLLEAETRVQ